jgi:hypothetical protein
MTSVLFVRESDFTLRAREVLREVADTPHQLMRVDVLGPYFPERDSAPFVRLVSGRQCVTALMTEVAPDQTHLRAYFPVDQPMRGRVEFGYAGEILGSVAIGESRIERLDPLRIDAPFHRVTREDLGAFEKLKG